MGKRIATRRTVLMEEIAGQQDHVGLTLSGQDHDLVEAPPAVILADGIALAVADMIVRGDQDANGVAVCGEPRSVTIMQASARPD